MDILTLSLAAIVIILAIILIVTLRQKTILLEQVAEGLDSAGRSLGETSVKEAEAGSDVGLKERPKTDTAPTAVPDEAPAEELEISLEDPEIDLRDEPEIVIDTDDKPARPSFRERLAKARDGLAGMLAALAGRGVDDSTFEELEEILIMADVGVPTTTKLLEKVREKAKEDQITDFDGCLTILRSEMEAELGETEISLNIEGKPAIWMFVGVNGVGKTTTIGKLANREVQDGKKVVLAAGDTFRAAAAEQLETWAQRSGSSFIRGAEGADPGSVVFDAVEHGSASGADLIMADTAGRLHNKSNLMTELTKIRRVAEKADGEVSEVLLVIDATTGQNGLTQAKVFTEAVDVTGIVLTKLDGSAKGGIVLAIQSELGIPVKLVGLGEGIDDLVEFDASEFVDALFA